MENISIPEGMFTPEVKFDFAKNIFSIRGNSYPENTVEFYNPILFELLQHLAGEKDADIRFVFDFIYFNSSTARVILTLIDELDACASRGNVVLIDWMYKEGDQDFKEIGKDFGEDVEHADFRLTPRSSV